jgi:hypothetical protein
MTPEEAVSWLTHDHAGIREKARREIARLGPEAVPAVAEALRESDRSLEAARAAVPSEPDLCAAVIQLLGILLVYTGKYFLPKGLYLALLSVFVGWYAWWGVQQWRGRGDRTRVMAEEERRRHLVEGARALAETEDMRLVGAFLECVHAGNGRLHRDIARVLLNLLPALKASDAALLPEPQRGPLRTLVDMRYAMAHGDLVIAAIRALTEIGDTRTMDLLRRMADGPAHWDREREVRAVARECLPTLREAGRAEAAHARLLRPRSAQPEDDALLRPASSYDATPSEQLLRTVRMDKETTP